MHLLSIAYHEDSEGWIYWIWKDNPMVGNMCGLEAHSQGPVYPSYKEALKAGAAALQRVDHAHEAGI